MLKVGELFAVFKLEKDEYEKQLKEAEASLNNFGKGMSKLGDKAIKGFGLALSGLGAASFKFGNEINKSMANVQTLIPGNIERVKELKGVVQSLAIETAKGTTDIADGLYQVISAFGDSADTAKILEINAKAATAGVATTLDAINLTSAVTKGYGDTTAEAVQKVSDLAFSAVKLGQTTFPELAASIGRVTPLAAALGVSMEELFGVMATATGVTGGAAEVSTQLRGILQSLMAPTDAMNKLITENGFASGKAMLEGLGLQKTLNIIAEAAEKAGVPLQAYIASIEGQTLALALTGGQADAFTEKLKEMGNVSGITEEAFNAQTKGINKMGFAWEQTKVRARVALEKLSGISPAMMGIGAMITVTKQLNDMGLSLKNIRLLAPKAFGALKAGAMSTTGVFGTLATAFRVAWAALLGPIGWILLAIAALAGAVFMVYKNWDKLKDFFSVLWGGIKQVFKNALDFIYELTVGQFMRNVELLKQGVESVIGFFKNMYQKVVGNSYVPDMIQGIKDSFGELSGAGMVQPARKAIGETESNFKGMQTPSFGVGASGGGDDSVLLNKIYEAIKAQTAYLSNQAKTGRVST